MILERLELTNFRCIVHADMEFASGRNLITGPNGAGKTSILEAIYLLGSGHSFKSPVQFLVQNAAAEFIALGHFCDSVGPRTVGVRYGVEGKECRISGKSSKSVADLARIFPVQVIDPTVHDLVQEGPRRRRMFIDWGAFHVEQSFHESWRRFNRALKQRNAHLKSGRTDFNVWDGEIAEYGAGVTNCRRKYVDELAIFLKDVGRKLLGEEVSLEYAQGWRQNLTFAEALAEARRRDQRRGTTTAGPHRADLLLKVSGYDAKDRISRGQQKMLACSLILAQQLHRASLAEHSACLLLDDPAAELDADNLGKLLDVIAELPVQLIATSLDRTNLSLFADAKKFHVEHGLVKAVA